MSSGTTVKIRGLEIKPGKGSSFTVETDPNMMKAHQNLCFIGARGMGKSTAMVNIVERLPYDRLFCVSPSVKSNRSLMSRLKLNPDDIFENPDDISILDKIKYEVEKERDDYEKYLSDIKKFESLQKILSDGNPMFRISDDLLLDFFQNGDFQKPQPKYGHTGPPVLGCIFDDCLGSMLFTKGIRKLNAMTIYHRHMGQLANGGALGLSLFFLVQSYRCQVGGLSKTIRGNLTSIVLFHTKSKKELQEISEECAAEISPDVFYKLLDMAHIDKFDFLYIDFNIKDNHPSAFRRNLDTFLIL